MSISSFIILVLVLVIIIQRIVYKHKERLYKSVKATRKKTQTRKLSVVKSYSLPNDMPEVKPKPTKSTLTLKTNNKSTSEGDVKELPFVDISLKDEDIVSDDTFTCAKGKTQKPPEQLLQKLGSDNFRIPVPKHQYRTSPIKVTSVDTENKIGNCKFRLSDGKYLTNEDIDDLIGMAISTYEHYHNPVGFLNIFIRKYRLYQFLSSYFDFIGYKFKYYASTDKLKVIKNDAPYISYTEYLKKAKQSGSGVKTMKIIKKQE